MQKVCFSVRLVLRRRFRSHARMAAVDAVRAGCRGLLCGALLSVFGCGGASVSVPPSLPQPLVQQLPLSIGLHLSEDLVSYVHEESLEGSGDWRIELGAAQSVMFQNLLNGMFASVALIPHVDAPGGEVDGVLVPSIEEVQFSIPAQTRSDYYEVWVRYRFRLHGRDGTLVGEWPLTAYGKANSRNYGLNSREPALQAAAVAAMRDAMAFFTVQFGTVPAAQSWIQGELGRR